MRTRNFKQVGGVGGGVDPPQLGHVPAAVGLVEEVGDRGVEHPVDLAAREEVVLDIAVGEDREGERRVRPPHDGVGIAIVGVTVEADAQVRHQPVDGVAQLVGSEQLVLDDPAGEHPVADLVAQERIVLTEQIEQ